MHGLSLHWTSTHSQDWGVVVGAYDTDRIETNFAADAVDNRHEPETEFASIGGRFVGSIALVDIAEFGSFVFAVRIVVTRNSVVLDIVAVASEHNPDRFDAHMTIDAADDFVHIDIGFAAGTGDAGDKADFVDSIGEFEFADTAEGVGSAYSTAC